jgi:hypothetical protein
MQKGFLPQFKLCLLWLEYAKFSNVFAIFHVISQYFLNSDRYFLYLIPIFCTMSHFWVIWNSDLCIRHRILPSSKLGVIVDHMDWNEICITYSRSVSVLGNWTQRQTDIITSLCIHFIYWVQIAQKLIWLWTCYTAEPETLGSFQVGNSICS